MREVVFWFYAEAYIVKIFVRLRNMFAFLTNEDAGQPPAKDHVHKRHKGKSIGCGGGIRADFCFLQRYARNREILRVANMGWSYRRSPLLFGRSGWLPFLDDLHI